MLTHINNNLRIKLSSISSISEYVDDNNSQCIITLDGLFLNLHKDNVIKLKEKLVNANFELITLANQTFVKDKIFMKNYLTADIYGHVVEVNGLKLTITNEEYKEVYLKI